jgi:hypothetical protein
VLAFFLRVGEAIVRALPAALARLLLVAVLLGAAVLHLSAVSRIARLEREHDALAIETRLLRGAVTELLGEIRGYRDDIRAENKALKDERSRGKR